MANETLEIVRQAGKVEDDLVQTCATVTAEIPLHLDVAVILCHRAMIGVRREYVLCGAVKGVSYATTSTLSRNKLPIGRNSKVREF